MLALNYQQARQEFYHQQSILKTGFLILTGKQVLHFEKLKEWEAIKENYPKEIQFGLIDLEKWHQRII